MLLPPSRSSRCRTSSCFPNVFLPLHIFEPRYREMVADALASDRHHRHGAAAARAGSATTRAGRRSIPIGCSRAHHARRAAARRPLQHRAARPRAVPRSRARRIERCATGTRWSSRCAEPLDAAGPRGDRCASASTPRSAARAARRAGRRRHARCRRRCPTRDLVNALAQYLDLEPLEKQALLEQRRPARARRSLVELLEMKVLMHKACAAPKLAH